MKRYLCKVVGPRGATERKIHALGPMDAVQKLEEMGFEVRSVWEHCLSAKTTYELRPD